MRTGRENRVIRYCKRCGYREEPMVGSSPPAATLRHGGCNVAALSWVSYEAGVEEAAAKEVITGMRVIEPRVSFVVDGDMSPSEIRIGNTRIVNIGDGP